MKSREKVRRVIMAIDMLVKFDIYHDGDSWCARGIGVDIFTQGGSLDELNANLKEAVEVHYSYFHSIHCSFFSSIFFGS